jgi:hypothetical protein
MCIFVCVFVTIFVMYCSWKLMGMCMCAIRMCEIVIFLKS